MFSLLYSNYRVTFLHYIFLFELELSFYLFLILYFPLDELLYNFWFKNDLSAVSGPKSNLVSIFQAPTTDPFIRQWTVYHSCMP